MNFDSDIFTPTRLNVIASDSGGGWLKKSAFDRGDRDRKLLIFSQALFSIGPMAGILDPEILLSWADQNAPGLTKYTGLERSNWAAHRQSIVASWETVKNWKGSTTLWYSTKHIAEYSFFVTFLHSIPNVQNVDFVNVADVKFDDGFILSTGECTSEMLENAYSTRFRLDGELLERQLNETRALFETSSNVRIFRDGAATEAPLDTYDARLLNQLDDTWRPTGQVIAFLYADCQRLGLHDIDYTFLNWRLEVLCEQGITIRRGQSKKPLFEENPLMGEIRRAV